MLFNSTIFLFGFLPVCLLLFFVLGRVSILAARVWLAAASLFFYAWWNPPYLILLAVSIIFNFGAGWLLQFPQTRILPLRPRQVLLLGLAFNLGFLGYFKYSGFLIENFDALTGADFVVSHIALPLAISFFTFQKIAYLVDSYLGKVKEKSFINYVLFAAFFPQLIAGPIVHYSEMFPQFRKAETYRFQWVNFTDGMSLFLLGLAKKVVLADEFARYSDAVFNNAGAGAAISLVPAWVGALSYTLQLYFDFSGYTDMAIGLARMFNIELPLNFWSPYKSASIIEFWRRWHMTLSRFLRDYVYIPLGGNRHGEPARYRNLFLTMLIGGIWHGAGWTYVLWGALHGTALAANHLWERIAGNNLPRLRLVLGHVVTMAIVVCGWVIFRSTSLAAAGQVFKGMLGHNGAYLPDQLLAVAPPLRHLFAGLGQVPYLGDSTVMSTFEVFAMLTLGSGIVFFCPNLYQMERRTRLLLVAASFAFSLQKVVFAGGMSPFLYFPVLGGEMRYFLYLLAACAASLLAYLVVFGVLVSRPLVIDQVADFMDKKLAYADATPHPKIFVVAGSNARFSHSCAVLESELHRPCVNMGISADVALDWTLDMLRGRLAAGDLVYMPIEYDLYSRTRQQMMTGMDAAYRFRHDKASLATRGSEGVVRAAFMFSLPTLVQSLGEMGLKAAGVRRRFSLDTLDRQGDETGHDGAKALPYRGVIAQAREESETSAILFHPDGAQRTIGDFLDWAHAHGVTVAGGLPTIFDDRPVPDAAIAALKDFYARHGATFLVLQGRSQYPRADFYDTGSHLKQSAAEAHSRLLAEALRPLLDRTP